jgi:beta-lactamase regulating signal transducer with metallopeptidase domain
MLDDLARASFDGAVLVGAIWVLTRAVPHLPAGVKATLWWCAATKFVLTLVWTPLVLPVLPVPGQPVAQIQQVPQNTGAVPMGSAATALLTNGRRLDWMTFAAATWILGLCLSAALAARRWRQTRAVIAQSSPAHEAVTRLAGELASALSVRRVPEVRMSTDIDSPLVAGVFRPVVLLPAGRVPHMTAEQHRMAICHELAHLQRGDVWLGCVPAAAERIFFFHPLVRLAAREYAFWREAACDAAVLRALGAAPQAYARLLLDLGVARPRPALSAAGAAWSFSNLKRRIVMLQQPSTPSRRARVLTNAVLVFTVLAVAPLRLGARPAVPPPEPPPAVSVGIPSEPAVTRWPVESAVWPQSKTVVSPDKELTFVLLTGDQTMMSGSSRDVERARAQRNGGEPLLWFRHEGREYIVRDEALVKQAIELWAPVGRIGEQQGEIGSRQGALGAKQGAIGAQQGTLGARQGALGARQGALGAQQGALGLRGPRPSEKERRDIEQERREIDEKMRELDKEMQALGEEMRKLEAPMQKLGAEMEALGVEMEALGRRMAEASLKAETGLRLLVRDAIASGAAQPVR